MTAWKSLEKTAARKLGGQRVSRGDDFSASLPDVLHDRFSIECKHRKKISQFLLDALKQAKDYAPEKTPLAVIKQKHMRGELVFLYLDDFIKILKGDENEYGNQD